ncbi:MAG: hypothetical protein HY721_22950 [Planctomycetes bacterium]|nr:hypothetical protein [Planctomycetota bacterium]
MSHRFLRFAGACLLAPMVSPPSLRAQNDGGFIESGQWACLVPLQGIDCRGGQEHSMLESWVAPRDVALESPVEGDVWDDIDFGSQARSAAWRGLGPPRFIDLSLWSPRDAVDFDAYLRARGLTDDFVLGLAVTYVENTTGRPLSVGLCTSSDDSIQVWISGAMVLSKSVCRPLGEDCDEVTPAVLAAGVNRVTVLVWEGHGGFGFRLGFVKPDGSPYTAADREIRYLGARGPLGTLAAPPVLERTYATDGYLCADRAHEVALAGSGFEKDGLYEVVEVLRGPVTAEEVTPISHGGSAVTDLLPTVPVGAFHRTVVGSPCSTDNDTRFDQGTAVFTSRATTGGDIWASGDTFELTFKYVRGDFDISVEILGVSFPAEGRWGKFGLMARQSLDATAKLTALLDHPSGLEDLDPARCTVRTVHFAKGSMLEPATTAGLQDPWDNGSSLKHPRFLRLTRRGDLVQAWVSNTAGLGKDPPATDDAHWVPLCVDFWKDGPSGLYLGFAVSVHNSSGCRTGEVSWRLVSFSGDGDGPGIPPAGVTVSWKVLGSVLSSEGLSYTVAGPFRSSLRLRGWSDGAITRGPEVLWFQSPPRRNAGAFARSCDIGEAGPCTPGSLAHDDRGTPGIEDDRYTITASGADIGEGGDQCHFAYAPVEGDFAVQARFPRVSPPGGWTRWGKYGLMARWDCHPRSAYFFAHNATATDQACAVDAPRTAFRAHAGEDGTNGEPFALWWQDVFGKEPLVGGCERLNADPRENDLRGDRRNAAPWLRLVRRGDTFYGYASEDGKDWRTLGSHTWPDAPETMLVGVAATSHVECDVVRVWFESFEMGPAPTIEARLPRGRPLPAGVLVAAESFDDAEDGTCPEGWRCARWGEGGFSPQAAGGRLRLADVRNGPLGSGEDVAAVAFLEEPIAAEGAYLFDFDVFFSFDQVLAGDRSPADGLAFCVLGTETGAEALDLRLGDRGGGLGYQRMNLSHDERVVRTKSFALNSFAIEVDTWHNGDELNDGDGGNVSGWDLRGGRLRTGTGAYHIGLDAGSSVASVQRNLQVGVHDDDLPDVYDPAGIHVRVLYDHGLVKAWVGSNAAPGRELLQVLEHEIEPLHWNASRALVGFTAATGAATCTVEVDGLVVRDLLHDGGLAFHRGDADGNGELEITDAVRVLGFLFLGGTGPPCLDAADADDNGLLEITDAIRVLGYLFLGHKPPEPPGPAPLACGRDGGQELGCAFYSGC